MVVNWLGPPALQTTARHHVDVCSDVGSGHTLSLYAMASKRCCINFCGILITSAIDGVYGPIDNGKTFVTFNLVGSSMCGIPIARILQGDLEGLVGRDQLAKLNPSSGSMCLWIEVSYHSPICPFRELTRAESGLATKMYRPRSV